MQRRLRDGLRIERNVEANCHSLIDILYWDLPVRT